jgi:hypothetical protein
VVHRECLAHLELQDLQDLKDLKDPQDCLDLLVFQEVKVTRVLQDQLVPQAALDLLGHLEQVERQDSVEHLEVLEL